ncbi:MAG: tRNA1(Val) (adenine(37)-N6)-methyltransferase [Ilyomonas sp.]
MPNSYFRFKQFTVHQEHCAMKVCTDACLFGAWAANKIATEKKEIKNVLDIGTGTGLLSLMIAQKNPHLKIDAVEIDEASTIQAASNFKLSPWEENLQVHHAAIQDHEQKKYRYDLIISNPPFYENDLKSEDKKRNTALHSSQLSLKDLLHAINKQLTIDGSFGILLPFSRTTCFKELSIQNQFFLKEELLVKQSYKHSFFRSILYFNRKETAVKRSELSIQDKEGKYTDEFAQLLKDYYLYL